MNKTVKQIRSILTVFLIILLMAVCKATSSFSITLAMSVFIFILVLPVVNWLEKVKMPSVVAVIIAALIMLVVLAAAVWFLFYAADVLVNTITAYSAKIEYVDSLATNLLSRWVELDEGFSLFSSLNVDWLGGVVMPMLKSVSTQAINIFKQAAVTILLALFLLLEKNTLIPKISLLVNPENAGRVETMMERINFQVSKYIGLKVLISFFTGLFFFLVCKSVKMELALIIGVATFLANFIPTFGSIVITVVTILVAIVQFLPNWTPVLFVAAGTTMTQMILGNIIDPRLQGSQLDLSPFVILASLSVFGYIWGIVGMLIAVPVLSIVQIMLANMDETKKYAMFMSSGKVFSKSRKASKTKDKGRLEEDQEEDDFLFPENRS